MLCCAPGVPHGTPAAPALPAAGVPGLAGRHQRPEPGAQAHQRRAHCAAGGAAVGCHRGQHTHAVHTDEVSGEERYICA